MPGRRVRWGVKGSRIASRRTLQRSTVNMPGRGLRENCNLGSSAVCSVWRRMDIQFFTRGWSKHHPHDTPTGRSCPGPKQGPGCPGSCVAPVLVLGTRRAQHPLPAACLPVAMALNAASVGTLTLTLPAFREMPACMHSCTGSLSVQVLWAGATTPSASGYDIRASRRQFVATQSRGRGRA